MKIKTIKPIILLILMIFLLIPTIAFASWWNPFSWNVWKVFKPQTATITTPAATNISPKINADNSQQNNQNNAVKITPTTGKTSNQPSSKTKAQPVSSVSGDIEGKIKYVVQIVCPVKNGTMSGTGTIVYGSSVADSKVLTNKHVLTGAIAPCGVYQTLNYENKPTIFFKTSTTFIFSKNYDLAVITPDVSNIATYPNTNVQFNTKSDLLNSNIYILGYPASAGNNITLTKGIVSGTEDINNITMFKTDAKIDSGNSGGAVFDESGKFIGIPTMASQGNFSSYGYIIPASVATDFLNVVEQEGYAKQNWNDPDLTLYTVSPSNTLPDIPQNTQPQQDDSQLKIEQCKSQYTASKSAKTAELDQQLNYTKSLTDAAALKSYQDCTANGVSAMPVGTSPEAFNAYISMIKTSCQNAFNEVQREATPKFDNLKTSEYAKLEQQLQQDYQNCLNK